MQEETGKKMNEGSASSKPNQALLTILANSLKSSMTYQPEKPGTKTRKCSSCGAARPADTDLAVCNFCGNSF